MKPMNAAAAIAFALLTTAPAHATDAGRWTGTWYASPQPLWGADFALPTNIPARLSRQTLRETAKVSIGGKRVRVVFSNRYGAAPLVLGEAHLALSRTGSAIVEGSDRTLTFGGKRSVTIPPGAPMVSDPVELDVAALGRVTVSTFFPEATPVDTFHWGEQQTAYIASGNATGVAEIDTGQPMKGRAFLSGILVEAAPGTRTVVAFGDSITDGNGSTPDADRRWPDYLAQRLAHDGVAVLNAGISGARVLKDRMGANALARFEHDVLSQPGVDTAVVLMGINDIGWAGSAFAPHEAAVAAQDMIDGYRQLIAQARMRGVRIVGATLTPYENALHGTPFAEHYSREKDAVRQAVNRWIRTGGEFDAVVDFDAVTRDPQHPARFLPAYDSGDHLHPGDAGYKAMADALDEAILFGAKSARAARP
jgi:lysophospholipase L1-like esterase